MAFPLADSLETLNQLESTQGSEEERTARERAVQWAKCSVGQYQDNYDVEQARYGTLPSVKKIRGENNVALVLSGMRTCKDVFAKLRGNRTCFQVCD